MFYSDNSSKDILSEEDFNNNIDLFMETFNMDNSKDKNDSFYKLPFKERWKIRLKENDLNKNMPKIKAIKRRLIYQKNECSDDEDNNKSKFISHNLKKIYHK